MAARSSCREAGWRPLADPGWPDEYLLNISTAALRARILERIKTTIARCAEAGFDAVEFDNLDSYTRSHGALAEDDAVAFARLLVGEAHRHGLAAGQKNAPEISEIGKSSIGFDFAISEQCHRFAECAAYTHVYGNQVVDIEYVGSLKTSFRDACDDAETPRDTLLRDMKLSASTSRDYAYEHCTQVSPGK